MKGPKLWGLFLTSRHVLRPTELQRKSPGASQQPGQSFPSDPWNFKNRLRGCPQATLRDCQNRRPLQQPLGARSALRLPDEARRRPGSPVAGHVSRPLTAKRYARRGSDNSGCASGATSGAAGTSRATSKGRHLRVRFDAVDLGFRNDRTSHFLRDYLVPMPLNRRVIDAKGRHYIVITRATEDWVLENATLSQSVRGHLIGLK